jgi:hypothetical protein
MARAVFERFDESVERDMQNFFETLSEKDQRRYAAVQARQLGHGGIEYVAEVLGCSTRTIGRGIAELDELPNDPAAGRTRRSGAGRKKSYYALCHRGEFELVVTSAARYRALPTLPQVTLK